ncbi:MAG: Wzz/FepE/Etk N-terminal domain-containing protein [Ferruginibacter sp.]
MYIRELFKSRRLILLAGLIPAILLFLYAKTKRPQYTSTATVFPLNNTASENSATSAITNLLGISDESKSYTNDASINIIELALSRNVREKVASSRIPELGNKTVTELLVNDMNTHKSFFAKEITLPSDSIAQSIFGGMLLNPAIDAKINKNDVLELHFTSTDSAIVKPVTEILISQISKFYIDLRTQKALADYNFTLKKIDSIETELAHLDSKAIGYQNSSYFTPEGKLEYELPKENLSLNKQRVLDQENMAINNKEEALWRLQKVTPIIETLDKPEEPFDVKQPSAILYAIIGFILGSMITAFLVIRKTLFTYIKNEIKNLMD